MSYSEENGQVVLRMHSGWFRFWMLRLGSIHGEMDNATHKGWENCECSVAGLIKLFCNCANSGNPNYTPYQVEEKRG